MPPTTRVTRVEKNHKDLAAQVRADRAEWDRRTKELLDSQIRTDRVLLESGEKLDERIGKLVSAIGELISRMPPAGAH
jgi:hypothetical protein